MFGVALEKPTQARDRLFPVANFPVPATEGEFIAAEKFVVDTSDSASVPIAEICPLFACEFDHKVEKPFPAGRLYVHMLKSRDVQLGPTYDWPVVELGGEAAAETRLSDLHFALATRGGMGYMSMFGGGNVFFIRNVHGVLRQARADWMRIGWRLMALLPADIPHSWAEGDRFYTRNHIHLPVSASSLVY